MNRFNTLPDDLIELIFLYLDVKTLCSVCLCCLRWRAICSTEKIWKKVCERHGWNKYGYGALDLMHLPSSDKVLNRTNVSGTSPKFEFIKYDVDLTPLPRWRMVFIKALFLENNWIQGHYNVLPTLRAHQSRVSAFDSNGMVLVSGSTDNLAIWDLDSLTLRYQIPGNGNIINTIKLQGHNAALSCSDGAVRIYNVISGRLLQTFHGRCSAEILRHINKDLIVCSYSDKTLKIWSQKEKKLKYTLTGHCDEIVCLAVHGMICVSGDWQGNVIFWDLSQGAIISYHSSENHDQGHNDAVMCCAIDEEIAVTGDGDGIIMIWKAWSGESIHCLEGDTKDAYCLEITLTHIASAGSGGTICVWSRPDYKLLHTLKRHLGVVRSLNFNGKFLISGGDRKMICVWCLKTGELLNMVHRNPDLLHLMWVNESKIITASPNTPGSLTVLSYW